MSIFLCWLVQKYYLVIFLKVFCGVECYPPKGNFTGCVCLERNMSGGFQFYQLNNIFEKDNSAKSVSHMCLRFSVSYP